MSDQSTDNMPSQSAIKFESPRVIAAEDQARADFYALLANLFFRAPDERLLQAIAIAEPPQGVLAESWRALADAASVVPAEAVDEEYANIFVGVGRPPLMLFASFYLAGFMMEKPLAELRDDLRDLGFARATNVHESEDHLAALCDVMRALILGDVNTKPADIAVQQKFFMTHINPWIFQCIKNILEYHHSNFYKRVADLAHAFFTMEREAFSIEA
jgi:TorA maturation chaperone TorD